MYKVDDYVRTKYGMGQIKKIWPINDIITVFEVQLFLGGNIKTLYYGDIYENIKLEELIQYAR
jgi:hypothetical protein